MIAAPWTAGEMRQAVIVGGGPAGTALLIAASRTGALDTLAQAGLTIVESGTSLGSGRLAGYAINGDSTAETFHSAVAPAAGPELAALASHPAARAIAARIGPDGGKPVPLKQAAALMDVLGDDLARRIVASGGSVLTGRRALNTTQRGDGAWMTLVCDQQGRRRVLLSRNVVLATGGWQPDDRVQSEMLAGKTLAARAGDRLLASGAVLSDGGAAAIAARLRRFAVPRVVVVGSSTSALAACRVVLASTDAHVTLLHRRKLRVFYRSAGEALADGYADFGPDDVCPVSGFVNRLGGFRMEARELVLHALGIGRRAPHPRLHLHHARGPQDEAAAKLIDGSDLVIHALGYRPRALPVLDQAGQPVRLAADLGRPMVDDACRVCDASGRAIPGLFGLGLAAGFVPSGRLGGEPSFSGQANGLWLWQNDVGEMIAGQIGPQTQRAVA